MCWSEFWMNAMYEDRRDGMKRDILARPWVHFAVCVCVVSLELHMHNSIQTTLGLLLVPFFGLFFSPCESLPCRMLIWLSVSFVSHASYRDFLIGNFRYAHEMGNHVMWCYILGTINCACIPVHELTVWLNASMARYHKEWDPVTL